MRHFGRTRLAFGVVVLWNCALFAVASNPLERVGAVDLAELLALRRGAVVSLSLRFASDDSVVVRSCQAREERPECTVSVVQWKNGSVRCVTQVPDFYRDQPQSSSDGRRLLFDFNDRKVPRLQRLLEILHSISTLGMIGPEDVNREVVQVIDTAAMRFCFEWSWDFPSTYDHPRSTSISPSGEFFALLVNHKIAIYRLPTVCDGSAITPRQLRRLSSR